MGSAIKSIAGDFEGVDFSGVISVFTHFRRKKSDFQGRSRLMGKCARKLKI